MINNVLNFPQVPDAAAQVRPQPDVTKEISAAEAGGKTKDSGDQAGLSNGREQGPPPEYALRLTVDKDPKSGDWVYRAIDRYTGEVVRQLPRQEVLDMRTSASYKSGSIIKTEI